VQNLEWSFRDRSQWESGAWDNEPDKAQWTDEATGLPCMIHRNHFGAWCGYVGVTPDHPIHSIDADSVLDVHGGITFTAGCSDDADHITGEGICHLPGEGEPDNVIWFGFDCAHYLDSYPTLRAHEDQFGLSFFNEHGTYRDMQYVKDECTSLAKQLALVTA
jgi:hypothetical protein